MPAEPNLYGKGETSDDLVRKGVAGNSRDTKRKQGETKSPVDPLVSRYFREIERYDRAVSDWYKEGDEIVDWYLDAERPSTTTARRFALLWANTETLKPAVYAKVPTLLCSRRFKDKATKVKIAAEILERCSNSTFDLQNLDETFRMVRDDRLLPGRGQAWVRYSCEIERKERESKAEDATEPGEEPQYDEKVKNEKVCVDHVAWKDFGHNVARIWAEVWLIWRAVYKTRDEAEERFGAEIAAKLTYNQKAPSIGAGASKDDPEDKAKIYECWDNKRRKVSWIAKGYQQFLEQGDPPIDFRDFYPCPEPCYATKTSKQLIPVPDYRYYRDQAKEINDLTEKIGNLTQWLIVKGFIPNGPSSVADPLEEALRDQSNTELFQGVDSWKEWTERGGAAKLIDWLPIEAIIQALQGAIQARAQMIQDVFQITGISDILRGQTDPNETLGAQELKAQTGTRRLKNTQDEIARFCRDIGRLVAEVIAEKFQPQTIAAMSGYTYMPAPQIPGALPSVPGMQPMGALPSPEMAPMGAPPTPGAPAPGVGGPMPPQNPLAALMGHNGGPPMGNPDQDPELVFDDSHLQLLRDDKMRNFVIDIETDSTIQPDENAQKQAATEFMTVVGQVLGQLAQMPPVMAPLLDAIGQSFLFLIRRYRAGRGLEESFESGFEKLKQSVAQMASQPNPEQQAAEAKLKIQAQESQQKVQLHTQETQAKIASKQQETQSNIALKRADLQAKVMLGQQESAAKLENAKAQASVDAHIAHMKAGSEVQIAQQQMHNDTQIAHQQMQNDAQQAEHQQALDAQHQERQAQIDDRNARRKMDLDAEHKSAELKQQTATARARDRMQNSLRVAASGGKRV
jgi:hypothetical protein